MEDDWDPLADPALAALMEPVLETSPDEPPMDPWIDSFIESLADPALVDPITDAWIQEPPAPDGPEAGPPIVDAEDFVEVTRLLDEGDDCVGADNSSDDDDDDVILSTSPVENEEAYPQEEEETCEATDPALVDPLMDTWILEAPAEDCVNGGRPDVDAEDLVEEEVDNSPSEGGALTGPAVPEDPQPHKEWPDNPESDEFVEEEANYAAAMLKSVFDPHSGPKWSESVSDEEVPVRDGAASPSEPSTSASQTAADAEGETGEPVYKSGAITHEFCMSVLQWQKEEKTLAKGDAHQIVLDVIALLKKLDALEDVDVPLDGSMTVCGDVHGQYYDLLNIWELNGVPSVENPYIFNGDFVDRGTFSVEVILALFCWKLLYPQHLHLARGNHETRMMNRVYGFECEVKRKYDAGLFALFCEAFCLLPLCHVINKKVFVVHGGLFSRDSVELDELRWINRQREPPDEGLMTEMLWSDPHPGRGRLPSKRGVGVAFGLDVTEAFLKCNDLQLVIRSHEMKKDGYEFEQEGKLITVFSAPNYCDQMGNLGAYLRLDGATMTPKATSFSAVPHPLTPPIRYPNPLSLFPWP